MYSELRNKEFGIIDLLKSGWKIFHKNLLTILIITLLVDFPLSLLDIAVSAARASTITVYQLSGLLSFWTSIAVMLVVEKEVLGSRIQATAALKKAGTRWPSAFASGILFGVLFLLRLLLVIPGIIFLVNTAFFLHAVGLRNQGWKAALDYSRNLVKGSFWKVFYTFLVILLTILIFPVFIFSFLMGTISDLAGKGDTLRIIINVIISLFSALASYLYVVTGTVFFLNMDYRKILEN